VSLLVNSLAHVSLSTIKDRWWWNPDGCFSIKSAFALLSKELVLGSNISPFEAKIFNNNWESPAPSKVLVFS
jgi:hypothetical protein